MFLRFSRNLVFLLILCSVSCSKEIETIPSENYETFSKFYPFQKGFWQEYQIDTTFFVKSSNDTFVTITNSSSFVKEEIGDTLVDFDSPYQCVIKIYQKKSLVDDWNFLVNHSLTIDQKYIAKNEYNLRFVKLQFPINNIIKWKGNKYIDTSIYTDFKNWDYSYTDIYKPYSINSFLFDTTIKVLLYSDSNAIEKSLFFEVYANNIGLVYAEYEKLEKQNGFNPWTKPENGYTIKKSIINWKK